MSKVTTRDLGVVKQINGKNGAFKTFNFDKSIKSITITREYETDGQTVTEVLDVVPNDGGYLNANINKAEDSVNFKLSHGIIKNEESAERLLSMYNDNGISSIFTVKVKS